MFLMLFFTFAAVAVAGYSNREVFFDFIDPPKHNETVPVIEDKVTAVKVSRKVPTLFLEEKESVTQIFSLFYKYAAAENIDESRSRLNLVSFDLAPEYYIMLKRPFRVETTENSVTRKYLLITEVSDNGAKCLDSEGDIREISREFLFDNCSGTVSWVYPVYDEDQVLNIGMKGPFLDPMQKTLKEIGYMVMVTGTYDMVTFNELKRFQKDFGLHVDGSAGPRTRALLYQMADGRVR